MAVDFRFAARSDVGLVRKNNQDSGYAGPHLLLLADGMGGPAGGDIASSVAVAHFAPLDADDHPAEQMLPLLRDALNAAHEELVERSKNDPKLQGLGTTCIALMRSGSKLAMVHIGDSRAYVLRGDNLTQVTTDHSFVQYLIQTGQITPEEAENHPQRSIVLRILGDSDSDVVPDESVREAVVGDRWLLCSDGLSGVVSADTIIETLSTIDDPGECAEELINLALRGGGPDNITCVIADVVPAGSIDAQIPQVVGAAAVDRNLPSRGGGGAAARAANLAPRETIVDEEEPEDLKPRSWVKPFFALIVATLVILGAWGGYVWSQTQYYVQLVEDRVVIFQGIPQAVGPFELSHPVELTELKAADLLPVERTRLKEPVRRSSMEEINQYVESLKRTAENNKTTSTTEPNDKTGESTPAESGTSSSTTVATKES
ncbi:PP2C family serine/threonine-protein phosphatase [Actinomyces sp.]|uniref:PP2C family protein-serine/threonine phosphatase n=1 Tax=Actinomyces sp. TaxID=29317 RepID=UPI002912D3F6|nr:PP2C family serine/threonine-protein phosphatase [Actinomyces sp.]MDU7239304.1 PP2C family serine/threonine-protein phosphatase [Actinomyces sp.]